MNAKRLIRGLAAVALMLASPLAAAAVITLNAWLSGGAENPPNASPGTGLATVIYDSDAHTLAVSAAFAGLLGTTTAAHIHCCVDAPGNVGVATQVPSFVGFPLGVMAGSFDNVYDLTLASSWNPAFVTANGGTPAGAEAALAAGLLAGRAYFNIHTNLFPAGEIRGFLQVEEPQSIALAGLGLLALFGVTKLRRRARAA